MNQVEILRDDSAVAAGVKRLPPRRSDWPRAAQQAYRSLLSELNVWCREQGCRGCSNTWVAEEAVREAWQ
jgi:hypothetical protein